MIQQVTDLAGNATSYDYDDLNRLQQAQTVGPNAKTFAYTYDHNSNRLTETIDGGQPTSYDYSNADQLETAGSTSFTYDENGNELTASGRRTSTYNAKDQLDSLTPQGQAAIPMSYTGTGQFDRVTRGSTSFTNSALGLTREDATSYTVDPDGFVLGQRTPTRTYFLHDGLGSVVATTNESGQESGIARYAPFGACLANCPSVPYRWLGGLGVYWDEPMQLHKMGTRYYDPALGRFTQVDPVSGGALNAYDYAAQNPINFADPSGTCIFCDFCPVCEVAEEAAKILKRAIGHSTVILITPRDLEKLQRKNISKDEVNDVVANSQGRYRGFEYNHHGPRIGYWHEGLFVSTRKLRDGVEKFVTAIRAGRSYADRQRRRR